MAGPATSSGESESVTPSRFTQRLVALIKHPLYPVATGLFGFVLGIVLPPVVEQVTALPVADVVTLMAQESEAGLRRDPDLARTIYAPDATVTDAGCTSGREATTWRGHDSIGARYEALPAFNYLDHYQPELTWNASNRWEVSSVRATARSSGTTKQTPPQLIAGAEQWTFTKVGDRWLISTFVYGLC